MDSDTIRVTGAGGDVESEAPAVDSAEPDGSWGAGAVGGPCWGGRAGCIGQ